MASGSAGGPLYRLWLIAAIALRGTPFLRPPEGPGVDIGDKRK